MKEPHKQGLANQFGRESCAGSREGTGEALTAGNPGQPLSSENITLRVPTLSCQGEGHTRRSGSREFLFDATESETLCMDGHSHRGNRETSMIPCGDTSPMGRSEKAHGQPSGMYATEESDDLVVPGKRARPARGCPGRNSGGGVCGGKGIDQGKPFSDHLIPDTAPDHWACLSESGTASSSPSANDRQTQGRSRMR